MPEETNVDLFLGMYFCANVSVKIQKLLKDNNLETDLMYYRTSLSVLDKTI